MLSPQILQEAPVLILVEPLELLHAPDPSADERLLGDHASVVLVPLGVRLVRRQVRVRRAVRLRGVDVVVGVDGELHRRGEPAVGFRPSPARGAPELSVVVLRLVALHGTRPVGADSRGARCGKCASNDPTIWRNLRSKCPKRRPSWHAQRVFRSPAGANEHNGTRALGGSEGGTCSPTTGARTE